MADTVVSNALRYPQDEGLASAIADGVETWASAGYLSGLAEAVGTEAYVHNGLTFTNHDGTNDQIDVASGRAYVFLSGAQVQSALGGSSPPSYDAGLVDSVPIMLVLPSGVADLDVSSGTLNPVWLAYATDDALAGVGAGDVYVRHGSSETAPPHPSVKLGETNPDDATADTRASDDPVLNARSGTFDTVTTVETHTESINANAHYFAGDFDGANADERLDNALSTALNDSVIYLERTVNYTKTRTGTDSIDNNHIFIGTNATSKNGQTKITADWEFEGETEIRNVALSNNSIIFNSPSFATNLRRAVVTVNADDTAVSDSSIVDVTFASGTTHGIADGLYGGSTVTDNGTNIVGDIT